MANPEMFNAILALTTADYDEHRERCGSRTPSTRVLFYRGLALKALHTKLQRGCEAVDVASVMAILLLMTVDTAYADLQPVLLHRRAVRQMMDMPAQPGRQKPGWWLQHDDLKAYTARFLSDDVPAWCLGPGETFLTPYGSPRRRLLKYLDPLGGNFDDLVSTIPLGFRSLALRGDLSIDVLLIIQRMAKVLRLLGKAEARTIGIDEVDFMKAYIPEEEFHECIDCLRRISPRPPMPDPKDASDVSTWTSLEHCVCLALVAFSNSIFGCMTYGQLYMNMKSSFREAVRNCREENGQGDCFVWTQLVGIWADMASSGPGKIGIEFATNVRNRYGHEVAWTEIESLMHDFLWIDSMAQVCQRVLTPEGDVPKRQAVHNDLPPLPASWMKIHKSSVSAAA